MKYTQVEKPVSAFRLSWLPWCPWWVPKVRTPRLCWFHLYTVAESSHLDKDLARTSGAWSTHHQVPLGGHGDTMMAPSICWKSAILIIATYSNLVHHEKHSSNSFSGGRCCGIRRLPWPGWIFEGYLPILQARNAHQAALWTHRSYSPGAPSWPENGVNHPQWLAILTGKMMVF